MIWSWLGWKKSLGRRKSKREGFDEGMCWVFFRSRKRILCGCNSEYWGRG